MTRLELLLLGLVLGLTAGDIVIILLGGFRIDAPAYAALAVLSGALLAGGAFYRLLRPDPRLAAMLFAGAFLTSFSAAAAMLNYLLLPVAGARVDATLMAWDQALGFHWPQVMAALAASPLVPKILLLAYGSMLPQAALLVMLLPPDRVYRFCLAMASGALICITVWVFFPAFGAFAVYTLDGALSAKLQPQVDAAYARELLRLLAQGPGLISPSDIKGLIAFPSYHTVMALLVIWFAWNLRRLRWPALILNLAVIASTPLHGGHHFVDILAGFPVAAIALLLSRIRDYPARIGGRVNKPAILTAAFVSKARFRIESAQVPFKANTGD